MGISLGLLPSIRSFSEILLKYDQEDLETQKEFLGIINSESERLTRLINDVLDLSRIEAGGMVWNDAVVSLEEIIRHILPAHQRLREEELIFKVQTLLEDRNRSILVADDNPGVRASLQMQLEDLGYSVYLAENGEEAMELLKLSVPDLLILDVVMPDKGGQEVLAWIRNNKDTRDLPVIILTGYPLFGELDRLRALGVEACMEKSKDLSPLFSKIDSIFAAPAP